MNAAILAVGSELLGTDRAETNSLMLARALERYGVALQHKTVVADVEVEIAAELHRLMERMDLVIVTGGLGPTSDDVTREAVAQVFRRPLVLDPGVLANLEERFRNFGIPMPEVNRKQAEVIQGAEVIANPRGTAPGLLLHGKRAALFLFPGVPRELEGLIKSDLEPWLRDRAGSQGLERRVVKTACMAESRVEEKVAPAYDEFGRTSISVLAKPGEVHLHLKAAGDPSQRRRRLEAMEARVVELLGEAVFARSEEETLEGVVGELLRAQGATVAVAESCTGGLLGERLTRVAGSSDYFVGGVIAYSNELKTQLLGVPAEMIAESGAVSEEVAMKMAGGLRERLGSTYGIAVTGVAGPDGGSDEKPRGTVHIALAAASPTPGGDLGHRQARFPGDRERVRWQASQLALDLLRRRLLGLDS